MIVVVPVAPPREGVVSSSLAAETSLSAAAAARLYEAAVADVLRAAASSGGDLLVNYRDAETLPADVGGDPETEVRSLVADALEGTATDPDEVRFERQVGSTRSARVGNTVTHLLEREGVDGVGVLEPTAPLVARTEIDGAAMSLRRHDVVLGPSSGGDVYLACFADPIDFAEAYDGTPLSTLAERAAASDRSVGFAPMLPAIERESGLRETVAWLEARAAAGRPGGEATAAALEALELTDGSLDRS